MSLLLNVQFLLRFQACVTLTKLKVENMADSKCKLWMYLFIYLFIGLLSSLLVVDSSPSVCTTHTKHAVRARRRFKTRVSLPRTIAGGTRNLILSREEKLHLSTDTQESISLKWILKCISVLYTVQLIGMCILDYIFEYLHLIIKFWTSDKLKIIYRISYVVSLF